MSKIHEIIEAKAFLEALCHSIDPVTGEVMECAALRRSENVRKIRYIMSLLDELISNRGEVVSVAKPEAFRVEKIDKTRVAISERPVQISGFATRINKQCDTVGMRRLGPSKISRWLIAKGYLKEDTVTVVKEVKQLDVTEAAVDVGIMAQQKVDESTGEVKVSVLLSRAAQEYVLENLESIADITDRSEDEGSSEQSMVSAMTGADAKKASESAGGATEPIRVAESVGGATEPIRVAESVGGEKEPIRVAEGTRRNASADGAVSIGGSYGIRRECAEERYPSKYKCMECKHCRAGDCFGTEPCSDFEPAFTIPKEERDAWPEHGEATMIGERMRHRRTY